MFWKALPPGTFWPGFVIATLAAIIASQALISAVFQIVSQAIVQGFFPRFHVYHTSREVRAKVSVLCTLCWHRVVFDVYHTSRDVRAPGCPPRRMLCVAALCGGLMTCVL